MEWWPFVLIFFYLFMIAVIDDSRSCLPALLAVSGVVWLLISISNYLSHYISAVHVFGFIVLWFPALMAYSYWNYHRCPACRTRNAFHATGTLSEDGLQEECRCDRCSHTGWQSVSQPCDMR